MRFAYADPPYPGQSEKHYLHHPDFKGEGEKMSQEMLDTFEAEKLERINRRG